VQQVKAIVFGENCEFSSDYLTRCRTGSDVRVMKGEESYPDAADYLLLQQHARAGHSHQLEPPHWFGAGGACVVARGRRRKGEGEGGNLG
jgi:hypothetical protein